MEAKLEKFRRRFLVEFILDRTNSAGSRSQNRDIIKSLPCGLMQLSRKLPGDEDVNNLKLRELRRDQASQGVTDKDLAPAQVIRLQNLGFCFAFADQFRPQYAR